MSSYLFDLSKSIFTHKSDVVNPGKTIFNPEDSTVKTLRGKDQIIGTSSVSFGLGVSIQVAALEIGQGINPANSGEFITKAKLNVDGIINRGDIYTNRGKDTVKGSATAEVIAVAETVTQAIAVADTVDATALANSLASVEIGAIANGINNSGLISTGLGADSVIGEVEGSVAAVATAVLDVIAIAAPIAQAPMSEGLKAIALGFTTSLAKAKVVATGFNNQYGEIRTDQGRDHITAIATSDVATYAKADISALAVASDENQALALGIIEAVAQAEDTAMAIYNNYGEINTGLGADIIEATANASELAIAIHNQSGEINTGFGADTIEANANASEGGIAIYNKDGHIVTGDGADTIKAYATGTTTYGIYGGEIRTGYGKDVLKASSFGGGVNIKMGNGEDYVEGFGEATIYGGADFDTLNLGFYNKSDFNIHTNNDFTIFELDGIIMETTQFEKYTFADGDYSFTSLIA